jgi:hypothetical protein
MKRTHEKSSYELVRADRLKENSKIILQVKDEPEYSNNGYNVYLCETVEKKDFERTTLEGQLAEKEELIIYQSKEIDRLQTSNIAIGKLLEEANDAREGLRNSLKNLMDENKGIYNALMECKRVFNDLPQEAEKMLVVRNDNFMKEPGNNE